MESKSKENNLNIIRFFAAMLVILGHAFPLTGNGIDPLNRISGGQISLGGMAVTAFFFYSGFLNVESVHRRQNARNYFGSRLKKLWPPLLLVTLVLVLIMGPLVSELEAGAYFANAGTYRYLLNALFVPVHELPGVFTQNPYSATVNGVLWTLPLELLCYVFCFLFCRLGLDRKDRAGVTLFPGLAAYVTLQMWLKESVLLAALEPAFMFYIGMLCSIYYKELKVTPSKGKLAAGMLVVAGAAGLLQYVAFLAFPFFLLWVAFETENRFAWFGKTVEPSYGMYLIGWPVQQLLIRYWKEPMTPQLNCTIACVASAVIVVVSTLLLRKFLPFSFAEKKKDEKMN